MLKTLILDEKAMNRAIARISYEIIEHNKGSENLCIIGILSGGVEIARRIATKILEVEKREIKIGELDITAYRDDKKIGIDTGVVDDTAVNCNHINHIDATNIDFSIEDKNIVLVDDVIFTGRSVRAAIDALMERGRPRQITLAVLIDRGHRELPIRADFVGKNLPTSRGEMVRVMFKQKDGEDKVFILKEDT